LILESVAVQNSGHPIDRRWIVESEGYTETWQEMAFDGSRLGVVQWATGNVGRRALREVIRHPSLELVGVLTYDPAKQGVDAGVLCGESPTGVTATTDRTAIHELEADCVLYMPRIVDVEDLVAFVDAGTNVVSVCMEIYDGALGMTEQDRARLRDACQRSGASVYGTGSSPGFISDILPFALLSLQRRVDSFEIEEFGNMSRRDSPHMLFEQIGFGKPMDPDAYPTPRLLSAPTAFAAIARGAGWEIERWTSTTEFAAARRTTPVLAGEIEAGTVGARRLVIAGHADGKEVIRFAQIMYLTPDLDPAWDVASTGWRVRVRGDASLDVELAFPISLDELAEYTPALTANPAVNAVPFVCAARPGILRTADLPPLAPAGPTAHA
jgi:4-hydroxy-tetrahydrodipicolinate reductase